MEPLPPATRARPDSWPFAADGPAAARLIERFTALGATEARLARSARGATVLAALGGNSPYLAELALKEPAVLRATLADGPEPVVRRCLERLEQTPASAKPALVASALRRAKRQVALAIALADLGGIWTLDPIVGALTDLAERTLRLAVDHVLLAGAARGELLLADPDQPSAGSGFVVLGMGKLGARELNYSSDIDLVLIYDPAAQARDGRTQGGRGQADDGEIASSFGRLARALVALMSQRDADGYVFRTDLRLRPDPAATAPAVSLPAALSYYESMGQNWERAAMLKARPVAGDLPVGHGFLDAIKPFIWRRGLDFAAVADIHAMKRRIDAHRGTRARGDAAEPSLAGFDLKLGQGGIREIEFLTQTLQLVWGGRDPALRDPTTLGALRALSRAGLLSRAAAGELADAYRTLRGAEHRLQMVADRQTHTLPDTQAALDRLAVFFNAADAQGLTALLAPKLRTVRTRYAEVFEAIPGGGAAAGLDFSGPDPQPATLAKLAALGFSQGPAIVAAVHGWQSGRVRALRSDRARQLLGEMLPALLDALARQAQPDTAWTRFDQFLARLPAGVQLLSLVQHNPALLDRIAAVLGAAPSLAEHLARVPQALEGLLAPAAPTPPARLLRERLRDAIGLEGAIEAIRRAVHEVDFSLSVDTMDSGTDADAAGTARAELADAAIQLLLPYVQGDIKRRFGTVPGGTVAIVALGKAGGREMMAGSDLDLMLIYDHPPEVSDSAVARGCTGRSLPVTQYYTRLAQTFIAALTAPGPEGPLYAVDMRLRPSGNAGPVAVSLGAFRRYHREHAWTWERMAMTRARVIAAPAVLAARIGDALVTILEQPAEPATLKRDAATMRARLARDLPPANIWDVKHRLGGLMEVEFIAQLLQLIHAGAHPHLAHPTTRLALARLGEAGVLAAADAALLIRADQLWRTVQGMLRVTVGRATARVLPAASAAALLRAVFGPNPDQPVDQEDLHRYLDATGVAVRAVFERLVGRPDPHLLEPST